MYYPIFLELNHRPCLVIGGGNVACQKTKALVACGARVTVVSPDVGRGLNRFVRLKKIVWRRRRFSSRDLDGFQVVVAATDNELVNKQAFELAVKRGIWINVVDQPARCSFIVPSVFRRGKLTIAISTMGASPALSRWIRKDLEKRYSSAFGKLLGETSKIRVVMKKKEPSISKRKQLYKKALEAYLRVLNKDRKS